MNDEPNDYDYLKRLHEGAYRGQAYVHWTLSMDDRKTGWLVPIFFYKFRELLTHTAFRYGLCSPIFCLMPDHVHLLWVGITEGCDQRRAMKFLRSQTNVVLEKLDKAFKFQKQPYDHVLREEERERTAFEDVAEYIARNPERKSIVKVDGYADYKYTSCLVPGYPDLSPFQPNYWDLFWRIYARLRNDGLTRSYKGSAS